MKKNKVKHGGIAALFTALLLAGCTSADVEYCRGYGVAGTSEYGKCIDHYHQQTALFSAHRAQCDIEADRTYPRSLYDYGGYAHVPFGGWRGGPHGGYYGGSMVRIDPDYRRNAEIDHLRLRIVEPCMQAKGWNSGRSWQAGRQAVKPSAKPRKMKANTAPSEELPWLY